jgi:hypothetical protein
MTTLPNNLTKKRAKKPVISPVLQLKWGLSLLGTERAEAYLSWLKMKPHN